MNWKDYSSLKSDGLKAAIADFKKI